MTTAEELLAARQAELDARIVDPLDFPHTWTERQALAYINETNNLRVRIGSIQLGMSNAAAAKSTIERIERDGTDARRWRDFLTKARAELCAELLDLASWRGRAAAERRECLEHAIKSLDTGLKQMLGAPRFSLAGTPLAALMTAGGYGPVPPPWSPEQALFSGYPWRGSLKDVEEELAAHPRERAAAVNDLEAAESMIGFYGRPVEVTT